MRVNGARPEHWVKGPPSGPAQPSFALQAVLFLLSGSLVPPCGHERLNRVGVRVKNLGSNRYETKRVGVRA